MFELNVMGVLRMTRALLPKLLASGDGLIVNVGSTSGFETYPGGAGYTASKHAAPRPHAHAPARAPRPAGARHRDLARAGRDRVRAGPLRRRRERARKVYEGMTPLTAEDVAEAIAWVATRPATSTSTSS